MYNESERALGQIVVGRKAWPFVDSDDGAEAAANIFSVIASCRLHRLDPEAYLRDVIRILAQWPRAPFLEVSSRNARQEEANAEAAADPEA